MQRCMLFLATSSIDYRGDDKSLHRFSRYSLVNDEAVACGEKRL